MRLVRLLPRLRTPKARALALFATKATITATLLSVLLARTPLDVVLKQIRTVTMWVTMGCVIALLAVTLLVALRWMIVLRRQGGGPGFSELSRFALVGSFFSQFLPSGIGGDAFRIWYVHGSGISLGRSLASVVVDRMLGLLALFAMLAIGIPYIVAATAEDGTVRTLAFAIGIALALGIGCFLRLDLFVRGMRHLRPLRELEESRDRVKRLFHGIEMTAATTRSMLGAWPDGPATLLLSLMNQVILGLIVYVLARAVADPVSLAAAMFMFPCVLLISMVPISLAGWGLREGAMVVVFGLVGMRPESAISVSVMYGFCLLVAALPGGVLWLRQHLSQSGRSAQEIDRNFRVSRGFPR